MNQAWLSKSLCEGGVRPEIPLFEACERLPDQWHLEFSITAPSPSWTQMKVTYSSPHGYAFVVLPVLSGTGRNRVALSLLGGQNHFVGDRVKEGPQTLEKSAHVTARRGFVDC